MMQEKINDRKQYVEQIRQSFRETAAEDDGRREPSFRDDRQAEEKVPRGYFKLRLVASCVLFFAFVFIWKTGWSYGAVNAVSIQQKIQTNVTLPESVPRISEMLSFLEQSQ